MKKDPGKLFLLAAIVIMLNVSSCRKEDDGDSSFYTPKRARLTGEWEVIEMDGEKLKNSGLDIEMEFEKDGNFSFVYAYGYYGYTYSYTYEGEWEWARMKEAVKIDLDGSGEFLIWEIKRLTNSEFWFEDQDRVEVKCEKK